MSIALNIFCFAVPLMMLFASVFSIVTGVGGCWWPNYSRDVIVDVTFWDFSNNHQNSASVADAMTFLIMLHSTRTGKFYGGIVSIVMLDSGPRKNIRLLCFAPLVLICMMYPNICGESFHFFCIMLLCLKVLRYKLKL